MPKEMIPEREHLIKLLKETRKALKLNNALRLKKLSDQTIHSASIYQHTDYIIIAILVYAMSKIVFRKEYLKIRNWNRFLDEFNNSLKNAIRALQKDDQTGLIQSLESAKEALNNVSIDLKPYIHGVLEKSKINKASKIYEHGISLGQTADLLGLSQWDLTEYIGDRNANESKYNHTNDVKQRAKMTLDFFSGGEQ